MPNCVRARVVVATGGLGIKPAAAPASGAPHPPFFDGVVLTPRGSSSLVALRLGLAGGTDFDLPLPGSGELPISAVALLAVVERGLYCSQSAQNLARRAAAP